MHRITAVHEFNKAYKLSLCNVVTLKGPTAISDSGDGGERTDTVHTAQSPERKNHLEEARRLVRRASVVSCDSRHTRVKCALCGA